MNREYGRKDYVDVGCSLRIYVYTELIVMKHKYRLQEHCVQDRQRAQAVTARERPPSPAAALGQSASVGRGHGTISQRGREDLHRSPGALPDRRAARNTPPAAIGAVSQSGQRAGALHQTDSQRARSPLYTHTAPSSAARNSPRPLAAGAPPPAGAIRLLTRDAD
ncbi:unnamed protein product [Danaus chrysippus]|uniref:(African queen) hypothetical protein n=1 Tax=Danaus chrysippus TaxID=151541 RepID=A0A8J2W6T2_9NEOP|nr:unnamed protein product [Danaus chrysippus]